MKAICPRCCEIVREDEAKCPKCGFKIREFDELDYEEKLIINLRHPVIEYRISAIRALSLRSTEKAAKALESAAEEEGCVPVLLEIVDALARMGRFDVIRKLTGHRSKVVSNYARRILEKR